MRHSVTWIGGSRSRRSISACTRCFSNALARRGRIRDGEEHLAATVRLFEGDGLDYAPIREAWRAAPARGRSRCRSARRLLRRTRRTTAPSRGCARRASIAVMPFVDTARAPAARGGAADALAHDVITRLAKLRSLFVIAQGSVFALHERHIGPEEAGRMLNVDYVVSGSLQREGKRLNVRSSSPRRAPPASSGLRLQPAARRCVPRAGRDRRPDRRVHRHEIETIERNRAILRPPNSLDAWEAHHRGLWHMYRFNRADNERARHFFATAVRLDPTFARAYAGLSFTHFQNAFQGWAAREPESSGPTRPPGRASWPTTAIRPRIGRWAARCGCAAGTTSR